MLPSPPWKGCIQKENDERYNYAILKIPHKTPDWIRINTTKEKPTNDFGSPAVQYRKILGCYPLHHGNRISVAKDLIPFLFAISSASTHDIKIVTDALTGNEILRHNAPDYKTQIGMEK